jgi:hypothetical protein
MRLAAENDDAGMLCSHCAVVCYAVLFLLCCCLRQSRRVAWSTPWSILKSELQRNAFVQLLNEPAEVLVMLLLPPLEVERCDRI